MVKPKVDPELDDLKETYNGLDSLLNQVAINIAGTIPSKLSNDVNVIYFPQLGFNIAMPLDERGRPVYDGGEQPWEQVFTTENRVYFKDFRMREMDERFGDIYGLICGKNPRGCSLYQILIRSQKRKLKLCTRWRKIYFSTKKCLWRLLIYVEK